MNSFEIYRAILLKVHGWGNELSFPKPVIADAIREVTGAVDNSIISRRINSLVSAGWISSGARGIYEFTSKGFEIMDISKADKEDAKEILNAKPEVK